MPRPRPITLRSIVRHPSDPPLRQYLDDWLAGKAALRPSTRVSYRCHIHRFLIPALGQLRLRKLTVTHIEHAYEKIRSGDFGKVSITTLHRIHATLMSALNTAVRRGLLVANPAALVELPRPTRPEMATWTNTQARAFLDGSSQHPWHLLYRILLVCGLRRGEALGLQWKDIVPTGNALRIRRQLTLISGQTAVGDTKSVRGRRTVHLDHETGLLLQAHRPGVFIAPGFIFRYEDGQSLEPAAVSRQFSVLVTSLGLPLIRLHDLRHTSASLGLGAGNRSPRSQDGWGTPPSPSPATPTPTSPPPRRSRPPTTSRPRSDHISDRQLVSDLPSTTPGERGFFIPTT